MSRDASVDLLFGGETRTFRLAIGQWRKVQEKCDAGPEEVWRRLIQGGWRVDDLREVIRQGLIGGGMAVAEVDKLLIAEFDELPLLQFVLLGQAIVGASLTGAPDEDDPPPGEGDAGGGHGLPRGKLKFGLFDQMAAAAGFLDIVDDLSFWRYAQAVEGWNRANGAEEGPKHPSTERHLELMAKHSQRGSIRGARR